MKIINNMPYQANSITKPDVLSWVAWVMLGAMVIAALVSLVSDLHAKSIFYAAFLWGVPQAYFCWQSFRFRGASQTKRVLKAFQKGMSGKIVLTGLICAFVFTRGGEVAYVTLAISYLAFFVIGMIGFNFKINHPRKR